MGDEQRNNVIGGGTYTQYKFLGSTGKLTTSLDTLGGINGGYNANIKYQWPLNNQISAYAGIGKIHSGRENDDMISGI